MRQLYDPELSLHINGIYTRLPESRKHFSKRQRDDRRRRRAAEIGTRSRHTGESDSRVCVCTLLITLIALSHPSPRRAGGIKFHASAPPRRWLPFSTFRQILSRIVLRNGILEISGEGNRYRVQTRNITGHEINLLDTGVENGIVEK